MTETENGEFIVVQRCATYGFWPEAPVESDQFEIGSPGEKTQTSVSICAEHYGNLEDHRQPPKPIESAPQFAFGLSYPKGFRSGAEYYVDDKGMSISLERRFPFAGEVDIFFKLASPSVDLPPAEVRNKFIQLMPALLLLIRMTTQDVIVPSWRLQTVSKIGGESQYGSTGQLRMVRKDREVITQEQIVLAFKAFAMFLHPDSNRESVMRLAVAARRIMNAYNETDLIDRFSDLWEACEILCPPRRGKIDYQIAKRTSDFTGFDQQFVKTQVVSKLYDIRRDIVHTFVEDLQVVGHNLPMLFDIASILYASYFGFRYTQKGPLADSMQAGD
jgi:Apea-like HEPN